MQIRTLLVAGAVVGSALASAVWFAMHYRIVPREQLLPWTTPTRAPTAPTSPPSALDPPTLPTASTSASGSSALPSDVDGGTRGDGGLPPDPPPPQWDAELPKKLDAQREELFRTMSSQLEISDSAMAKVREIFDASKVLGQGNPDATRHPMTRAECVAIRERAGLPHSRWDPVCKARNMVPLFDQEHPMPEGAVKACIDQYEFPDVPCDYPVVYASGRDAAQICEALGKRICDSHEWEGACAGAVLPAEEEYPWGHDRMYMRWLHNGKRDIRWAYGTKVDHKKCATTSIINPGCDGGGWTTCGSNTFPAGAFPECVSPFGVYDLHGNAAEHMNFPLTAAELASTGGHGQTEMKGSWFIFSTIEAHPDDCRWRAPDWHPSRLMDKGSHLNYHLGFRCCKNVDESE